METNTLETDGSWEKIGRYLSGNMNENETIAFRNWLEADVSNKELLSQAEADWALAGKISPKRKANVDAAWQKVALKITQDQDKEIVPETKVIWLNYKMIANIAAVFIIGLIAFWGTYTIIEKGKSNALVAITQPNELKNVRMPDASMVYLNKESKIEYPKKFHADFRKVKLDGEAFFEIQRDVNKPFVISAQNAEITVLGTSFNVNTRLKGYCIEVSVRTGKVKLSINDQQVILKAGETGIIENQRISKKQIRNDNYLAWRNHKIVTDGEKISEILEVINSVYNVRIVVASPEIGQKVMSKTTIDNYTLDEVLNLICTAFDLESHVEGRTIILTNR